MKKLFIAMLIIGGLSTACNESTNTNDLKDYEELQSRYETLQSSYDNLEEKYDELRRTNSDINMEKEKYKAQASLY